jgi:hypothetical protein
MKNRARHLLCGVCVALVVLVASQGALAQKVAVFVQASAPVPTADLEVLKIYANQRCALISGVEVASPGELMAAQRQASVYLGASATVDGVKRLAQSLDVDYLVVLRIVRWESEIGFRPERSLLLFGVTSFVDTSLQILTSPLSLLFGLDKKATVCLFATVYSPGGDVKFTTAVTCEDKPLLSLITADPLEAAKRAIQDALYQLSVVL